MIQVRTCRKLVVAGWLALATVHGAAQGLACFTSPAGRFVVFDRGRFKEIEPRTPTEIHMAGDELVYITAEGTVKRYETGRLDHLAQEPSGHLEGGRGRVLLRVHDAWYRFTTTGPVLLTRDGRSMTIRDSLLVYHDRVAGQMVTFWKGRAFELAGLTKFTDTLQWEAGGNTVTWHVREDSRLKLFYQGRIEMLSEGTDAGIVSAGDDIVAWMDLGGQQFRVWTPTATHDLEDLRPRTFLAGTGNVAYVDAAGVFKVWSEGAVHPLLDHPPTTYAQHDSLLVFIDRGQLQVFRGHRPQATIPYIPEAWSVREGALVFLGLDRDLRRIADGREEVIWRRSGVRSFTLYGDAVLFRDADDMVHVWWNGRLYSY